MTYLAPRQGLFAIIILISFFIQTTLLLISTDQQLDELKMQTGERMLVQLIDEVKLPLLSKDKVSLSVLTGRYTSENNVASLAIKDIDNEVLLQTGQAQLLDGNKISRDVVMGDTVIGKVEMTLRDTSNGEIIASQWIFILGSFITHLLIWLIYGYIARPTRAQLAALSRDVQDYLITQRQHGLGTARTRVTEDDDQPEVAGDGGKELSIHQALNKYIKSRQNEEEDLDDADHSSLAEHGDQSLDFNNKSPSLPGHLSDIDSSQEDGDEADASQSTTATNATEPQHMVSTKQKALASDRPLDVAVVQIRFYDPNHLLNTLAYEKSEPYFVLCTQLLQRTLDELLKQPILFGIKVKNQPRFDENGAVVEFYGTTSHSKAGLAAVMLAKAYVMLNEVAFIKHRELQRFALEVVVGVSDEATSQKMEQLLYNNAYANDILTLLPVEGIKQLRGHIQLDNLKNPTTVYERDCASLQGVGDSMMQRLIEVRDAVLMSALN